MSAARILRGRTVYFRDDPRTAGTARTDGAVAAQDDGAVVVRDDGRIAWSGAFADVPDQFTATAVDHFPGKVIMPGFIDAHVHFPQHRMIAAPAKNLLDWLNRFAFHEEAQYGDEAFAAAAAEAFLDKLIGHGTTSALAFSSVHKVAADCLFKAARARGMAMITGKTMMDRNAPEAVLDTAEASARDSADLIGTWHGVDRLRYAVTVRFAVTSTEAQLQAAGELYQAHPDCLLHSCISTVQNHCARQFLGVLVEGRA